MGRTARYDEDTILDAALSVLESDGMRALNAARVCAELGAPSGSLYHRFASRDALLAALWLRCAERFQGGFLAALEAADDPREGAHAAVRWFLERARAEPAETRVLMSYRREDLGGVDWPLTVQNRAKALAAQHRRARNVYAQRLRWPDGVPDMAQLDYALIGLPYALVHLQSRAGAPRTAPATAWVLAALDAVLGPCWPAS